MSDDEIEENPESCKACRFFIWSREQGEDGLCRRYPRVLLTKRKSVYSYVQPTDWCGEYRVRNP